MWPDPNQCFLKWILIWERKWIRIWIHKAAMNRYVICPKVRFAYKGGNLVTPNSILMSSIDSISQETFITTYNMPKVRVG